MIRRILDDPEVIAGVVDVADVLRDALPPHVGERLPIPYPDDVQSALLEARARLERALAALTAIDTPIDDAKQKKLRAQLMTGSAIDERRHRPRRAVGAAGYGSTSSVGSPSNPRLEIAPLDVGPLLREGVWEQRTAILTSATIPASLVQRVGFPPTTVDEPTSAARSTTPTTPCCTARCHSPTRVTPATATPCTTSSPP